MQNAVNIYITISLSWITCIFLRILICVLNIEFLHKLIILYYRVCIYLKKNRADLDGGVYDVYTGKVVTKYTIVTQVYTYDPINT